MNLTFAGPAGVTILIVYAAIMLGLGVVAGREQPGANKSLSGYFLGGRDLGIIVLLLHAVRHPVLRELRGRLRPDGLPRRRRLVAVGAVHDRRDRGVPASRRGSTSSPSGGSSSRPSTGSAPASAPAAGVASRSCCFWASATTSSSLVRHGPGDRRADRQHRPLPGGRGRLRGRDAGVLLGRRDARGRTHRRDAGDRAAGAASWPCSSAASTSPAASARSRTTWRRTSRRRSRSRSRPAPSPGCP